MKSFLEEYGFAILAAIVVILLIAMCTPVGTAVKNQVLSIVENFANTTDKKTSHADSADTTANIMSGTLYVQSASKTDKYHYVIHGTQKGELVTLDNDGNPVNKVEDGSELTGEEAVKQVSIASVVNTLDEGSVYYVEVVNDGTGYTFTSNIVTNSGVIYSEDNDREEYNELTLTFVANDPYGFYQERQETFTWPKGEAIEIDLSKYTGDANVVDFLFEAERVGERVRIPENETLKIENYRDGFGISSESQDARYLLNNTVKVREVYEGKYIDLYGFTAHILGKSEAAGRIDLLMEADV